MIAPTIAPINPALLSALYQPTAWPRIGGNEGADNSKDGRQNETSWLIGTGVNPFRNDACNEADEDGPHIVHVVLRLFSVSGNYSVLGSTRGLCQSRAAPQRRLMKVRPPYRPRPPRPP